jgi:hypothetical protein
VFSLRFLKTRRVVRIVAVGWSCEDVGRRKKIGRREGERSLNKSPKRRIAMLSMKDLVNVEG